jgi:hypothetical protein
MAHRVISRQRSKRSLLGGIPNLQRQLAQTPTLFAQAVGLVYKRRDAGEDPPEWHIEGENARSSVATQAYTLLHQAKLIPGTGDDGKVDVRKLKEWIKDARALCRSYGREQVGDNCIGELLSKSGRDEDGIWPAIPVRNALEEIGNKTIARRHGGRALQPTRSPLPRARRQTRARARGDVSGLVQADRRRLAVHLTTPRANRAELRTGRRVARHRRQPAQASAGLRRSGHRASVVPNFLRNHRFIAGIKAHCFKFADGNLLLLVGITTGKRQSEQQCQ